MNKPETKHPWIQLGLLGSTCLIGWVVASHYLFNWTWSTAVGMGVFFSPFFFGFLGVAFYLPRMME